MSLPRRHTGKQAAGRPGREVGPHGSLLPPACTPERWLESGGASTLPGRNHAAGQGVPMTRRQPGHFCNAGAQGAGWKHVAVHPARSHNRGRARQGTSCVFTSQGAQRRTSPLNPWLHIAPESGQHCRREALAGQMPSASLPGGQLATRQATWRAIATARKPLWPRCHQALHTSQGTADLHVCRWAAAARCMPRAQPPQLFGPAALAAPSDSPPQPSITPRPCPSKQPALRSSFRRWLEMCPACGLPGPQPATGQAQRNDTVSRPASQPGKHLVQPNAARMLQARCRAAAGRPALRAQPARPGAAARAAQGHKLHEARQRPPQPHPCPPCHPKRQPTICSRAAALAGGAPSRSLPGHWLATGQAELGAAISQTAAAALHAMPSCELP